MQLVRLYDHLLYVSCNPTVLLANLSCLKEEYAVRRLAVFDHFAYTRHLEVAVHLVRRDRQQTPRTLVREGVYSQAAVRR